MRRGKKGVATVVTGLAFVAGGVATAVPAAADPGSDYQGAHYFLNDSFTGKANTEFYFGRVDDLVYFGDWNGDGIDTPMIQRGNQFLVRESNTTGGADYAFTYGNPGDVILVGDWDGDGTDTLAVRRYDWFYVKNSMTTGVADVVFSYGNPYDEVLVGDWDGDGKDTLMVRRDDWFYVKNSTTTGVADSVFSYGNPLDTVLVGDWDGNGTDTLAVVRSTFHLRNSLTSGVADVEFAYGQGGDSAFAGDWNGDGIDTIGLRRMPAPVAFGDGEHRGLDAGIYSAPAGYDSCAWWRMSAGWRFESRDFDHPHSIVEILPTDAGMISNGCGTWMGVEWSFPLVPATSFTDGTFMVGTHIEPGRYQNSGGTQCFWGRQQAFGSLDEFIDSRAVGAASTTVDILPTDAGFYSSNCGSWTKVG